MGLGPDKDDRYVQRCRAALDPRHPDGGVLGVYRLPHVVQAGGAQDDPAAAREASEGEHPEE